jgi:anti-sigma B factor antagonist
MALDEPAARDDPVRRLELAPTAHHRRTEWAALPDFGVLTSVDGEVLVAVRGEIDIATAPQLWQALDEAIPQATDRLVVDLARTTFIDSTALAVLMRACKQLRQAGGDLVLRAPSTSARKVLDLSGFDRVMTIEG